MAFKLYSPAFRNGDEIPLQYTCEGRNISPPLFWEGVPENAKSLVLMVTDPDAPDPHAPTRIWTHWIVYGIPPAVTTFAAAASPFAMPTGCYEGLNGWNKLEYGGPCPPIGRHRYFYTLYALDIELPRLSNPTRVEIESLMNGHILEQAQLFGTYAKHYAKGSAA